MSLILRILSACLVLILTGVSLAHYGRLKSEHARAFVLLRETGLADRQPQVAKRMRRERDPQWSKLAIARSLLAEAYDQRWLQELEPAKREQEIEKMGERLDLARDLAAEVLSTRPATWQAAMILGGATLFESVRSGTPGVIAAREAWEKPLRTALGLAPGEAEPRRLLAGAYLGIWPTLSSQEQREARELIAGAFEDQDTFRLFGELWLQVAGRRDNAFSLVPDRTSAWRLLQSIYARRLDWQGYVEAHRRWDRALLAELERDLHLAKDQLHGGDTRGARSLMLSVMARARQDRRYAKTITQALSQCPPGLAGERRRKQLSSLLDWALEQYVVGKPVLESEAITRLAAAAGELRPEQEAMVALATGDLLRAERAEHRSEAIRTEAWAPYLLLKARLLAEGGNPDTATAALAQLHSLWRRTAVALEVRRLVSRQPSGSARTPSSGGVWKEMPRTEWPATEWRWKGRTARLYLLPTVLAGGMEIGFDVAPPGGRPVEVRWDQEMVEVAAVASGGTLVLSFEIKPGLHVVDVDFLTSGRVMPGKVQLLDFEPRP